MQMTLDSKIYSRLSRIAPALSAAILLALLATGGVDAHRHQGIEPYMASVRIAIENIPVAIGSAVGTNVEPTRAATDLLSPNKILQRRYLDPATGRGMSLLVVHCGDVRDMLGHFPPVCYPAHGWQPAQNRSTTIEIAGTSALAHVYEFVRTDDLIERRMTILNFFILPGSPGSSRGGTASEGAGDGVTVGQIAADMRAVERVARLRGVAGLGVAQVQIVMDGTPGVDEQTRIAGEVLPVLEPLVRAIGQRPESQRPTGQRPEGREPVTGAER